MNSKNDLETSRKLWSTKQNCFRNASVNIGNLLISAVLEEKGTLFKIADNSEKISYFCKLY